MSPVVVLVGPPGSGKTSVGRALARRWAVPFRDTDDDVAARFGEPIADIFVSHGEAAFRAAEVEAVRTALAEHEGVLALGGGAVVDARTRAALREHVVVLLEVSLAAAIRRVGLSRDRPLLLESPRAQLAALMQARRPLYLEVADHVVDTSEQDPPTVAEQVAAVVGPPTASPS